MSKIVKEDGRSISIFKLKEWGYLESGWSKWGGVKWTNNWGEETGNIGFSLDLTDKYDMYIKLNYKVRDYWEDGEWKHIEQRYPIVSTPCNYGGQRYWFECSIFHNGIYCGRRVGKLYLCSGSKYFACRHCYDLTYRSRIEGFAYSDPEIEEYGEKIKRWYYRGQPTRKHRQYLKMEQSISNSWNRFLIRMAERMEKRKGGLLK